MDWKGRERTGKGGKERKRQKRAERGGKSRKKVEKVGKGMEEVKFLSTIKLVSYYKDAEQRIELTTKVNFVNYI